MRKVGFSDSSVWKTVFLSCRRFGQSALTFFIFALKKVRALWPKHWQDKKKLSFTRWNQRTQPFSSSHTVLCFLIICQGPVVPQGSCQMDRDTTPAPLLGAESLTPVTQGTGWLQVALVEHVSQMAYGQGVIQLVHVSLQQCHYDIFYILTASMWDMAAQFT